MVVATLDRRATLATTAAAVAVAAWVGHERMLDRKHASFYAHVQEEITSKITM